MNESDNRDRSPIVQSREAEIDLETSTNIITGKNDLQPNNNNDNPDNTPGKILNPLQMSHLQFLLHQILKTRWKKRISVVVKVILLFLRVPTVNSIFCISGCGEEYALTNKKDDWLQCVHCKQWLHESCSKFQNICEKCYKFLLTIKK